MTTPGKIVIAYVITTAITTYVSSANAALKDTTWKSLCGLEEELRKLPSVAATTLERQETSVNAYKITGLKTLLYGHTLGDSKDAAAIASLGLTLLKKADEEQSSKHTGTTTAIKALTSSQELVGRIHEGIEILAIATHDSVWCLGNTAGTADAAGERTGAGCKGKIHDLTTTAANLGDDVIDSDGYKTIQDITDGTGVADSSKCPFTAVAANHQTWGAGKANAKMIDGMLTFTTAEQVTRSGFTKKRAAKDRLTDKLSVTVHADVMALKEAYRNTEIRAGSSALKAAAEDNQLTPTLTRLLQRAPYNMPAADADAEAKNLVKTKFSTTGSTLEDLWKQIKDASVVDIMKETEEATTIEKIQQLETLRATIELYAASDKGKLAKLKKELEQAQADKNGAKVSKTTEECNDHKELGPCQKAGCKFDNSKNDGEKCFPDPEAKTDKKGREDGKTTTTSTTGSNSVLINKAPILLAFLLF
uniref:Variant surface glycoprotein Buw 2 n=1 Tax=Trypanosoma brucei rhodesiense TaxID=31286 RepID=Q571V8_TRYBR|nr:variant surface glycoprotein Buw 2 [Trypanosoma brucei rhodesiense]